MKSKAFFFVLLGLVLVAIAVAKVDFQNSCKSFPNKKRTSSTNAQFIDVPESILMQNPFNGVFPVNIISFEAERKGTETTLFWDATDEWELVGYQVEKSCGDQPFSRIGWVYSKEISREPTYGFTDQGPSLDVRCFYRLKMVDFDGTEAYSPVIAVPAAND